MATSGRESDDHAAYHALQRPALAVWLQSKRLAAGSLGRAATQHTTTPFTQRTPLKYINDVRFWLTITLCITAIVILVSSVKVRCKGWLLGFLILSPLTYAGYYVPGLLLRNEAISSDSYRKFIEPANVVFSVFGAASWVLLLTFVVNLKSVVQTSASVAGEGTVIEGAPPLPDSPYRGYGGWLAFFGAVQLFVQPILAVIMLVVGAAAIGEASSRYPSFIGIYCLEALVSIAVVGLGMYAAIQLRRIHRGAVRAAKRYLLAGLAWSALSFVLPYLGDIPDNAREAMLIENVKGFVRTVIPFAIWFSYFNVSKRVKATYVD